MRKLVVAGMLAAMTLIVTSAPVAAPHIGGTRLGPAVVLWGGEPGYVGDLTLTAEPLDPTLLFYRFDTNADGSWEYPSQAGCGSFGCWTTESTMTRRFFEPFVRACVQAWDGVSTRVVDGVPRPRAPIGCTDYVEFVPPRWSRFSPGRIVHAHLEIPTWLSRADFNPRLAEVEGLHAILWPWRDPEPDQGHWMFRVDRQELTRLLGPGTHTIHLTLRWADATFSAAGQVIIAA